MQIIAEFISNSNFFDVFQVMEDDGSLFFASFFYFIIYAGFFFSLKRFSVVKCDKQNVD